MQFLAVARKIMACAVLMGPAHADTLSFYTGAPDLTSNNDGVTNIENITGTSGFNNGNPYTSLVYQSFVVTMGGWDVTSIFSNDAMSFLSTNAFWEIRSGMVGGTPNNGNGGTLINSGINADTQTLTPYTVGTTPVYTVAVSGLSIVLAPGTYWLAIAPVGGGNVSSSIINTDGANSVIPPGGTSNICNFPADGINFEANCSSNSHTTFSMGLYAAAGVTNSAPEPGAMGLFALGGLALMFVRKRL